MSPPPARSALLLLLALTICLFAFPAAAHPHRGHGIRPHNTTAAALHPHTVSNITHHDGTAQHGNMSSHHHHHHHHHVNMSMSSSMNMSAYQHEHCHHRHHHHTATATRTVLRTADATFAPAIRPTKGAVAGTRTAERAGGG
ncbi:hypothetical protein MMC27_001708 [Xylographa pallens]|nr:hypothetical protein [Xylographa pallens]